MSEPLTNFQKAVGYIQLLKQEGKLDAEAVRLTKEVYELTDEEAKQALQQFKDDNPEAYTAASASNIWHLAWVTVVAVFIALMYYFFADEIGGVGGSVTAIVSLVFVFMGFIIFTRMLFTLKEYLIVKHPRLATNAFFSNKAAPAVVVSILFVVFSWLNYTNKSDELTLSGLRDLEIVLENNCYEEETGGKSPESSYILKAKDIDKEFDWSDEDHKYRFHTQLPDILLKAGDTIKVYIQPSDIRYMRKEPTFLNSKRTAVYDIEKDGVRFLNLKARNEIANQSSYRFFLLCCVALLISSIVAVVMHNFMHKPVN